MNLKEKFSDNEIEMISELTRIGTEDTWYNIAIKYNIKPEGNRDQRRKAANDVWRKYKKYQTAFTPQATSKSKTTYTKRLFYDIETSYNIVKAWRAGYNLSINSEDIIHERAVITIAYKWEGDTDVTVLAWDKGDDRKVIEEFVKVMAEADELVGHNIDKFDTKFVLGRALYHGIETLPKYKSTDTLKIARSKFMLNSNKLDYIAQLLGIGAKTKHRGMAMWDDIILRQDKKALEEMIEYNVQDVFLTEEVYNRLVVYTEAKNNFALVKGASIEGCPECGGVHATELKMFVSKAGTKSHLMKCDCGTNFTINNKKYTTNYAD